MDTTTNEATNGAALTDLDADYQLTLEQDLLPSPNTIELERTPEKDFMDRLRFDRVEIGELYMENSKIVRSSDLNMPLDPVLFDKTRAWYIETAYRPKDEQFDDATTERVGVRVAIDTFPDPLGGFLRRLVRDERICELLYAIDLQLLVGGRSYRLSPMNDWLWLDRFITQEEGDALMRAIIGVPQETMNAAKAILAYVAVPVRYALFQGPRGYRRTLVDLGALLERSLDQAAEAGIELFASLDVYDNVVDRLLLLDGIERSIHAIAMLGPSEPSLQQKEPN